jgi:hypothetical protein
MITLSRLLVCAWLITWVPTTCLFTTYLPDLPTLPDATERPASLQYTCHEDFFPLSNHVSNCKNDNAVLSEENAKPKNRNVGKPDVIGALCSLPNRPLLPNSVSESRTRHPGLLLFAASDRPRAPPNVVFL